LCGAKLNFPQGIEVGHVFKLGTGYSESMKATFQDGNGEEKYFVMGCYGIGVSRVVAACIEQNHDEDGIVFPVPMAPYTVIVLNLGISDEVITGASDELYNKLKGAGLEVLLDDRDERPGAKLKDADLIGIPYRVTVGKRFAKDGVVEIRQRRDGETTEMSIDECVACLKETISSQLI
ncbi:MAG TPA: proline--tRNA ligase, partial [Desulfobacterales bacterium]|nr:proline--tRNA ligase [Desulfobacterales bacterium]